MYARIATLSLALLMLAGFTLTDKTGRTTAPDPVSWRLDKSHSQVIFKVRHLGISHVTGRFKDFDITLDFDPQDLKTLRTTANIKVNSIDTENERRDNHLRSEDFFFAEQHPEMTFVSKEVRDVQGNTFKLVGDLTMRGVTREVVLDGEFHGTIPAREGKTRAALSATGTVNRMDYGLKWNNLTETGGLVVGHDVEIEINLEALTQ